LSRADKIAAAGLRTAKEAREAANKRRRTDKRRSSQKSLEIESHRHCVVCWKPIPLDSDPAVCDQVSCMENNEKRESSRKRLTIMLYLFPGIAILLIFLQLMSGGS